METYFPQKNSFLRALRSPRLNIRIRSDFNGELRKSGTAVLRLQSGRTGFRYSIFQHMAKFHSFFAYAQIGCFSTAVLATTLAAAPVPVNVDKKPVELDYKTYPLGHPPPHPNASPDTEAGL